MAVNWTKEQKKAIETSGCNLLVAAAAGSGKTAVLVERIVNLVADGKIEVDELLVTTFTEAAAKKMKQEIADEMKKRLEQRPGDKRLARQLVLLARADICTIDSFCLKVVRANFHLLDLDPDFSIASENETELLREQAAEELFARLYEENDEAFYSLLECYAQTRGDAALSEVILRLHSFIRTMPDYEAWIARCVSMYESGGSLFDSPWGALVRQSTDTALDGCIRRVRDALTYARETEQMASYCVPLELDEAALLDIKAALASGTYDDVAAKLRAFRPAAGGRAKPKTPEEVKAPVAERREAVKKSMAKLAMDYYYTDEAGVFAESEQAAAQVRALCAVASQLEALFFERKKSRGVLDFGDIEHLCLRALMERDGEGKRVPSAVARLLQEKYKMILVDEYQDSNELQETIFSLISRGDNIFMVGDIKQSIYRFRHTNPLLFKQKKDTYSDTDGVNRKVIMSNNFRSRKEVIDAVNFIFAQTASQLVGEIDYDEEEALHIGASYPPCENAGGAVEVHILGGGEEEADGEGQDAKSGAAAEAARVARRILELRRDGFLIFDKKTGYRPMQYRDIVILMRSPSVDAQIFTEVLQSYGIPVFSDVGGGYFVTEEVELILSLLSVIDNPMQDIKLLGVMRSPIGGFDDSELLEIRLRDSASDIYGALNTCAAGEDALAEKCGAFLARLELWRGWSLYMTVHELIWALYTDTGYYDFVGAMAAGRQRQANLKLLIEYARSYEKTSFRGLFHFVSYAERIKSANRDVGGAKILGENQDVVRIMSIHKSKGLEFGVVFVTRLAKQFNIQDLSKPVLLHGELGIGVDFIDCSNRYRYPTFIKRAIREKLRLELLSEELRVLYVALTRAREKLILTMSPRDCASKKKKWLSGAREAEDGALPLYYTSMATGLSDWVGAAVLRHEAGRAFAGEYIACDETDARFALFTGWEYGGASASKPETCVETGADAAVNPAVEAALGWEYPYRNIKRVPTKVSVTELKRLLNNEIDLGEAALYDTELLEAPAFLSETQGLDAAARGSALHFVLQHLDLSGALDKGGIARQIEEMLEKQIIKPEQAAAADAGKLARFFAAPLGRRMLGSGRVVREMPFEVAVDAALLPGSGAVGEQVLLQGIIDCFFYEDDGIVLVDYKTDRVKNEADIAKIKDRYAPQLALYAAAIEQITGKKVKQKNLYLFSCESVVQ